MIDIDTALDAEIKADLADIEQNVTGRVHLADLIRTGSRHTEQAIGSFGQERQACAWSAAALTARSMGLL